MKVRPHRVLPAFTLAELVLSLGIMTLLLASLASAVVVGMRALPSKADGAGAEAAAAVDMIAADLRFAKAILSWSPTAVTLVVPDRGYGAAGDEIVRYQWSGINGAALTRTLNNGATETICEGLAGLALEYVIEMRSPEPAPRVLMVRATGGITSEDQKRISMLTEWGFEVTAIEDTAIDAAFAAAIGSSDVIYISEEMSSAAIAPSVQAARIGVVTEKSMGSDQLTVSSNSLRSDGSSMVLAVNSHPTTTGLSLGTVTILTSTQELRALFVSPGATAQVLANTSGGRPLMVVYDAVKTGSGDVTLGRRVKPPWGWTNFQFDSLNTTGVTLLQRSLLWAAQRPMFVAVRVRVRLTNTDVPELETGVELPNTPWVP